MSWLMTFFSVELVVSLIIVFVMGVMMLSKGFDEKKKNLFGGILLGLSLFNLVFFNAFIVKDFNYGITEIVSIVLLFIITFATGLILLVAKEISKRLRKFLGLMLVLLPIVWIVLMAFSS